MFFNIPTDDVTEELYKEVYEEFFEGFHITKKYLLKRNYEGIMILLLIKDNVDCKAKANDFIQQIHDTNGRVVVVKQDQAMVALKQIKQIIDDLDDGA